MDTLEDTGRTTRDRMARWTQKLLDFSARNRLLNIPKASRHIVELHCDDVASLEDRIAAGNCVSELPQEERRRLVGIYHDAKTALEESGVNTLFVAIGALQWVDPASRKSYKAPILLVPARLERRSMSEGMRLSRLDEDTILNPTLVEFLRTQHGVAPEGIDPLPADESGIDVKAVFESFQKAIASKEGWAVLEEACVGCFSFGKFVMWKDMTARAEELKKSPLVSHLVEGGGMFDDGVDTFPAEDVAEHFKPSELYCPVSYDSSQLAAVLYSALGKTFVLHGPPGTGKSQTITNIIAHNLALGRRVLFVSEKKAALDVVKNRLDRIGLSPFCLELHSNKTEKSRFYAQLKEALEVPESGIPGSWSRTVAELEKCRAELESYVGELHRRYPNGLSAYDCFVSKMAEGPKTVEIVADALAFSEGEIPAFRNRVAEMSAAWRATSADAVAALEDVKDFEWNPAAERETSEALGALSAAIRRNGCAFVPKVPFVKGLKRPLSAEEMRIAAAGSEKLASRPGFIRWLFAFFAGLGKKKVEPDFADKLDKARQFMGESRGVMRYRAAEWDVSLQIGTPLAEAMEKGDFPPEQATEVFDRSFAEKTLEEILAKSPALANFAGLRRDEQILEFRRLDAKSTLLARRVVFAKLAEALPRRRGGQCPDGTELGKVKRECEKKSRQKAVRQMLAEAKTLVPVLKPCFLMSPLSVAQYLPVDSEPFDMVVFDEASQIPVWDAIGVIARARQLVVVGDPKQMPPTNFFQKGEAEDEDFEEVEIEDQESILDECLVAGVYSTYLNWHYRSRHESLITFSNEHYYDSRLCTFPSASDSPRLGVKFMFVEGGRFVKPSKGPRVNPTEAKALVDYVCGEVLKPGYRRRSIGIVTFSMPQQKLVRTMLEERRAADPALEAALPEDGEGAYFVKNLENVQGDESDVILFSIGYAPDENGRFTMNFGPLNLSGGERRLNVAVTRAREQVVVFSSIRSSQIDAGEDGRTKAVGAGHLKAFLEYAEQGGAANGGKASENLVGGFGDVVAAFLSCNGYEIDRDVGCSSFKIDVAVRDPADHTRHIAGIECDGPSYAGQRTEQDRDVNRAGVLRGLGWRMLRVWSVDWAFDRKRAEESLLKALEDAKNGVPEPKTEVAFGPEDEPVVKKDDTRTEYRIWTSRAARSKERFADPANRPQVEKVVRAVVEREGPIYADVLARRVAGAWGVTRMTDKASDVVSAAIPSDIVISTHGTGGVYWPSGVDPESYAGYRVPSSDPTAKRAIDEIPLEEIRNAMRDMLADLGTCPKEDLYRETMKTFGYASVTPKSRTYLDAALSMLPRNLKTAIIS